MCSPNAADRALQMAVGSALDAFSADTIIYQPRSGAARSIEAIVEYPGPAAINGLSGGSRPVIDIYVKNDSTIGIGSDEIDTGGDKIQVPPRFGRAAVTMRIVRIVSHDKATLHLQAQ